MKIIGEYTTFSKPNNNKIDIKISRDNSGKFYVDATCNGVTTRTQHRLSANEIVKYLCNAANQK